MGVDCLDQLFYGAFEPQRQYRLSYELGGSRANHMNAENLVVLLVAHDLHEPFDFSCHLGSPQHAEGERTDANVVPLLLCLGLRETDASYFRFAERAARDVIV